MKPKINWKEIKTVLLDMDGTLLDLYFDYYFWQEYLPEQWAKQNNMNTKVAKIKLLDWYQQESGTLSWYCLDFWTEKLNFDVFALKADVRHLIKYRPYAESFLKRLNTLDLSLTMVTNAHEKLVKMKADETGIDTFFNQIISSHSIGYAKEEYAFWEKLTAKISFNVNETLLIDESSMIRSDIFDLIDLSLKKNRRNKKPFGGVQIILFGDLLQLSPVVSSAEKEVVEKFYPKGAYFFNARCFHSGKFAIKELSKIFRQTDVNFINLLNKFRIAKVDSRDLSIINKRMIKENSDLPKETIILSPRNSKVDEINNSKLNELQTETYTYTAKSSGTFKESAYPVKKELNLKVGAQIMITKNDQSEPQKWVNGTLATIEYLSKDEIKIKIKDKILNLPRSKWESIEYRLSGNKINPKVIGSFIAYPIKLAWAATIHKCQGQTFDHVAIDLDSGAFTHGQTYVALSRAKSIEGVHLLKEINQSDLIFDKNVFSFLGHKLEKKYIRELLKTNKIIKKKEEKNNITTKEIDNWTIKDDSKLIVLYKKNVPEIALSKIFKKEISEIRSRILKLTVR